MVPDYISEKVMKELKDGRCAIHAWAAVHSSQWTDAHRQRAMWHMPRTLIQTSVNTMDVSTRVLSPLNLVDVACSSEKDEEKFWKILDERLELCHRALMCRHKRLLGTKSDVAPILWQNGALARLKEGREIDRPAII